MCGGGPDPVPVPEPSEEERALQRKQAEAIELQNTLLKQQMAETAKAREEMKDFYSIYDPDTMKGLLSAELEMTQTSLNLMKDYLTKEPTELEKKYEAISLLQAERTEKALKGELPIAEGTQQRYEQEKKTLSERLSRKLGSDWETTTPGVQAMGEFEKRWGALMDAERRGEIDQGSSILLSMMGMSQDLARSTGWATPGTVANPASALSRSAGYLEGMSSYGYGTSLAGLQGMGSSISQAYQPYQFYSGLALDANKFNAQMEAQAQAGKMQLIGTLAGAALGGGSMMGAAKLSDHRFKNNVVPIDNALEKILALNGYSFQYVGCDECHHGVMAQELEGVVPELVYTDEHGVKYVKMEFHALFVEAFKELTKRLMNLETQCGLHKRASEEF